MRIACPVWPKGQLLTPQNDLGQAITAPAKYVPILMRPAYYWTKFHFASGFGETANQFQPPYQDGGATKDVIAMPANGSGEAHRQVPATEQ